MQYLKLSTNVHKAEYNSTLCDLVSGFESALSHYSADRSNSCPVFEWHLKFLDTQGSSF